MEAEIPSWLISYLHKIIVSKGLNILIFNFAFSKLLFALINSFSIQLILKLISLIILLNVVLSTPVLVITSFVITTSFVLK